MTAEAHEEEEEIKEDAEDTKQEGAETGAEETEKQVDYYSNPSNAEATFVQRTRTQPIA